MSSKYWKCSQEECFSWNPKTRRALPQTKSVIWIALLLHHGIRICSRESRWLSTPTGVWSPLASEGFRYKWYENHHHTDVTCSSVQPFVSQSHVYDKEKQQQAHCSWVCFILKSHYLKLHLRIDEPATPFDDVIPSLMMLLLDPFAYAAVCCPCHYSTSMIPVPFADGETGACQVLEAAKGLLASYQLLLTISSSSVPKPRSQLCGICAS